METKKAIRILDPFVHQGTVLLTTYRKVGTPVGTPVSIAVDGKVGYIRSWSTAGKIKRIRNNPIVTVEPSTFRGKPSGGPHFRARARLLSGAEAVHARHLLARKHPILHGVLVPFGHRIAGYETVHVELTPLDD